MTSVKNHIDIAEFQAIVRKYYQQHGRHDMPWRQAEPDGSFSAYKILVSEIMLQQTQVARVSGKYQQFIETFPTVDALAAAPLAAVLALWSGLGYNRRAKFLWQAAQQIVDHYQGVLPASQPQLQTLPGIGFNTAGAIVAYAYNQPVVFVETNIRTVFIHHFYKSDAAVTDKAILQLVKQTLPVDIRLWYWALMDYGAFLKQSIGNMNKASTSYVKQSVFAGSARQLRGRVLKLLTERPHTIQELTISTQDDRLPKILLQLEQESLVSFSEGSYRLG